MKRFFIVTILLFVSITSFAQSSTSDNRSETQTAVLVPGYKLFPTTNMWIFLKLDTSRGLVKMVQYGMEEKKRVEVPINFLPLASGEDAIPGRFNLYSTQNMWTFILLDEVDGRTWQVQWSLDGKEGIVPISGGITL